MKEGKGELLYVKDGSIYRGDFRNGIREGRGELINSSNDKFSGEWTNDMRHGFGKMEESSTGKSYYG